MSAIKKWLPRAHIEICRNKDAAITYVEKEETAVPGTQHDVKSTVEQVTMMDNLLRLCEGQAKVMEQLIKEQVKETKTMTKKQLYEEEYWRMVNLILEDNPDLISTYTMPQYTKAWINCRSAILTLWRQKEEKERTAGQPDRNEVEPPELTLIFCPICEGNFPEGDLEKYCEHLL